MKSAIIIQARMSSTRLAGKVLKDLAGKEVLWHVVDRCKKSRLASAVIVATSTDKTDDVVQDFCRKHEIEVFRGELNNVLKRYYECAKAHKLDLITRVTADCPLVDPKILDASIQAFLRAKGKIDYLSNCLDRVFPRGLDCEVFSFDALQAAYENATDPLELEHVTLYQLRAGTCRAYRMPRAFHGDMRLTLDEEKDYALLKHIYDKFYISGGIIDVREVIAYLNRNPKIARINSNIAQKQSVH